MRTISRIAASAVAVVTASSALAETNASDELGAKVNRAYELYARDFGAVLAPSETRVGIGFAYTLNQSNTLGIEQRMRAVTTQASIGHGFGNGFDVSATLPYTAREEQVAVGGDVARRTTESARGPLGVRVQKRLPFMGGAFSAVADVTEGIRNEPIRYSFGLQGISESRPGFLTGGIALDCTARDGCKGVNWNAGVGLSVNHALSIGGGVSGRIAQSMRTDTLGDSTLLNLRAAYQTTPDFGISVDAGFGMSGNVPDATFGATLTWSFK